MIKIGYIINIDILFGLLKISNDDIMIDVSKGFNKKYVEKYLIENTLYELLQKEYNGRIIKIDFVDFFQIDKVMLYLEINHNGLNYDDYIEKLYNLKKDIEGQIKTLTEKLNVDLLPVMGELKVIN